MNEWLEQYLDTVNDGLKRLPPEEREKEIAELRQHLNALAQARSELGYGDDEAIVGAIQQFGQAPAVWRRLLAAYHRRRLAKFRHTWLGAVLCTLFAACLVTFVRCYTLDPLGRWISGDSFPAFLWSMYVQLIVQGCLIGWLSNRLCGWRCLPVFAVYSVFFYRVYIAPQFRHEDMSYAIWIQTWATTAIIIGAPLLSAFIALRQSRKFRKV